MRPRVFPAEDLPKRPRHNQLQIASMRPRVFPAEDLSLVDDGAYPQRLQ